MFFFLSVFISYMNSLKFLIPIAFFAISITSCNNKQAKPQTNAASTSGAVKIAYVDPEQIIPNMPEYQAAKTELETLKTTMQKQLETEQQKAQQYYTVIMNKVQQGILAPAQQKAEEDKLMKMQEELQRKAMKMEEDMMAKEQEMTKPMYDKFNEALKEIAKSEGYAYVIDKKLLLYSEGGIDATEKLKTKLGVK